MKRIDEIKTRRQNQHILNRLKKGKEVRKMADIQRRRSSGNANWNEAKSRSPWNQTRRRRKRKKLWRKSKMEAWLRSVKNRAIVLGRWMEFIVTLDLRFKRHKLLLFDISVIIQSF